MDFNALLESITPDTLGNLRQAVELGRWPDGRKLEPAQRELCLQAVIAWESRNLPAEQRTGYIGQGCKSQSKDPAATSREQDETILRFQEA